MARADAAAPIPVPIGDQPTAKLAAHHLVGLIEVSGEVREPVVTPSQVSRHTVNRNAIDQYENIVIETSAIDQHEIDAIPEPLEAIERLATLDSILAGIEPDVELAMAERVDAVILPPKKHDVMLGFAIGAVMIAASAAVVMYLL